LTAVSILGITNNANYKWEVVASGTTTGGTWVSAGTNSAVEYNITGTSFSSTGGRILATGFFQGSNQGSNSVDILKEALFASQLERNPFTSTAYELTLLLGINHGHCSTRDHGFARNEPTSGISGHQPRADGRF
jgi:hypothetical protein